jgi:hypothetical protein
MRLRCYVERTLLASAAYTVAIAVNLKIADDYTVAAAAAAAVTV